MLRAIELPDGNLTTIVLKSNSVKAMKAAVCTGAHACTFSHTRAHPTHSRTHTQHCQQTISHHTRLSLMLHNVTPSRCHLCITNICFLFIAHLDYQSGATFVPRCNFVSIRHTNIHVGITSLHRTYTLKWTRARHGRGLYSSLDEVCSILSPSCHHLHKSTLSHHTQLLSICHMQNGLLHSQIWCGHQTLYKR